MNAIREVRYYESYVECSRGLSSTLCPWVPRVRVSLKQRVIWPVAPQHFAKCQPERHGAQPPAP
jgi:hypothetical protein